MKNILQYIVKFQIITAQCSLKLLHVLHLLTWASIHLLMAVSVETASGWSMVVEMIMWLVLIWLMLVDAVYMHPLPLVSKPQQGIWNLPQFFPMVQMYAQIWLLAYLVLTVETFLQNYFMANFVKNLGNGEKHFQYSSHSDRHEVTKRWQYVKWLLPFFLGTSVELL